MSRIVRGNGSAAGYPSSARKRGLTRSNRPSTEAIAIGVAACSNNARYQPPSIPDTSAVRTDAPFVAPSGVAGCAAPVGSMRAFFLLRALLCVRGRITRAVRDLWAAETTLHPSQGAPEQQTICQ